PSVKFFTGVIAALAWLTYPGYYWMPVLMMGYLTLASGRQHAIEWWKEIVPFLLGALCLFIPFEMLYACYGKSLLYGLAGLSLGINQGDYHESLQFIVTYMQDSNGTVGTVLSYAFLVLGMLKLLKLLTKRMPVFDPLQVCIALAFGAWLFHILLGEVLEFMVFYGRLVHAFVPFMIWALLALCIRINGLTVPLFLLVLVGSIFSFLKFNRTYQAIVYPRDVLYSFSTYQPSGKTFPVLELAKDKKEKDLYCNSHVPYAYYNIRDRKVADTLTFYNTAILYPIEGQEVVRCDRQSLKILLRAPYYLCFSPYGFEGYSPSARKSLQSGWYTTEVKSIPSMYH
ncbi:MAG TPA: hypothetical protein VK750_01675, partial [Cytophagaceae bacterium]|nr:hypothetical protein [Cytophagaceae bacterium]